MSGDQRSSLSRRALLIGAPIALAAAACVPATPGSIVNVQDHGATGNGRDDDSDAIRAAVARMKPGDTLRFPAGTYRFAMRNPPEDAAVALTGLSDVSIEFDPGAELLMDNLDPATGHGTSHGILLRGPASRVSLRNVRVRWAAPPSARSHGDGIRIVGYPAKDGETVDPSVPSGRLTFVALTGCEVTSSPQAGVIMMGVSDIVIAGLRLRDTLADGLHFNACRQGKVTDLEVSNAGDDALALVTYYADSFRFDPQAETFAFPDLNDWSNTDLTVDNVRVRDGQANGVRLAGAHRVTLSNVTVRGHMSGSGLMVDSAAPGVDAGWWYVASKHIRLQQILVEDCAIGLQVLARPSSAVDDRFTGFLVDGSDIDIRGCTNWSLRAESLTDQIATGLRFTRFRAASTSVTGGSGGVGLENTRAVAVKQLSISHVLPVRVFVAVRCRQLDIAAAEILLGAGETPSASPCVTFQDSDGRVDDLHVSWPAASPSWTPVEVTGAAGCTAVAIERVTVNPPTVVHPVAMC